LDEMCVFYGRRLSRRRRGSPEACAASGGACRG